MLYYIIVHFPQKHRNFKIIFIWITSDSNINDDFLFHQIGKETTIVYFIPLLPFPSFNLSIIINGNSNVLLLTISNYLYLVKPLIIP